MSFLKANLQRLPIQWRLLMNRLGAEPAVAGRCFDAIHRAYSERGRHYHTLEHIGGMLRTVHRLRASTRDLPAVELAVWFHDVVYLPRRTDNEELSARFAARWLAKLRLRASLIDKVRHLILATRTHRAASADAKVLIDADLAILAASQRRYSAYAQAIRQEYAWVKEADYRAGRARVLQHFLNRKRLFYTSLMERVETRARRNLRRELALLHA
ncbi:MAG: hypothetical protein AB1705_15660 [Verrucomicrobiota bacterium]